MDEKDLISKEEAEMLLNNEYEEYDMSDNMKRVMDVKLELSVVIGRTKMKLKDVLNLNRGALIELDTLASQDVEILVGDKVIAYGEVVVVDLNFGVKITKIVDNYSAIKTMI